MTKGGEPLPEADEEDEFIQDDEAGAHRQQEFIRQFE